MSRNAPVAVGDRFTRVGQPDRVFTVANLKVKPGFPDHAELRCDQGGVILIGISALVDNRLYARARN